MQHYIPFPSSLRVGQRILKHRIESIIGDGSDCISYKVRNNKGEIKVLKECYPHAMNPDYPNEYASRDINGLIHFTKMGRERFEMFQFGAKIFQEINHPILMGIDSIHPLHNSCYVIGQYINGSTLHQSDMSLRDLQAIVGQIVDCIKLFHEKGLIHGDLTGSNILIQGNKPYIVDFSSVKESPAHKDFWRLSDALKHLTDFNCDCNNYEDWVNEFLHA